MNSLVFSIVLILPFILCSGILATGRADATQCRHCVMNVNDIHNGTCESTCTIGINETCISAVIQYNVSGDISRVLEQGCAQTDVPNEVCQTGRDESIGVTMDRYACACNTSLCNDFVPNPVQCRHCVMNMTEGTTGCNTNDTCVTGYKETCVTVVARYNITGESYRVLEQGCAQTDIPDGTCKAGKEGAEMDHYGCACHTALCNDYIPTESSTAAPTTAGPVVTTHHSSADAVNGSVMKMMTIGVMLALVKVLGLC